MYERKDLEDINWERARLIDDAITELKKHIVPGTAYTAYDLCRMTGDAIPAKLFEKSLARGYHVFKKRERLGVAKKGNKYHLFGDWRASCTIQREGVKLITIKEYDEDGNLISEYKKKRGRPYYTATF